MWTNTISSSVDAIRGPSEKADIKNHSGREQCESKLSALGFNVPSKSGKKDNDEAHEKDYANLCHAIRTAEATEEAASYALAQFMVSTFSIGIVIVATYWAYRAAHGTWKASEAAWAQVKHSDDATKAELRAYIGVVESKLGSSHVFDWRTITIKAKNFGSTPAHAVTFHGCCDIGAVPRKTDYDIPSEFIAKSFGTVAPGQEFTAIGCIDNIQLRSAMGDIGAGRQALYLFGSITYVDAFGFHRTTPIRSIYVWENGIDPNGIFTTVEGVPNAT